jgi:hypothetical protein
MKSDMIASRLSQACLTQLSRRLSEGELFSRESYLNERSNLWNSRNVNKKMKEER